MRTHYKIRGFTFIELMITLAMLGVLAMISVPIVQKESQRAKERELRFALIQIREAIDAYKKASEQGRIPQQIGESGYPARLEDLVAGVNDQKSPAGQKIYFLRKIPRDPMFLDFSKRAEETWGLRSYASDYDEPRAGADIFDVYSRSSETGLNGVPYKSW